MNASKDSVVTRLVDRVFPRMPDFYSLLNEQCDLAVEAMEVFVQFMEKGDMHLAKQVRALEKRGDELKARNTDILSKSFSTPMDREDIYRAIATIDHIVNYAKTTTREIEALKVEPDKYMLELAVLLKEGAYALQRGYKKLSTNPNQADEDAQAARKAERSSEKVYRRALGELFQDENYIAHAGESGFKYQGDGRTSGYRHLQAPRSLPPLVQCRRSPGACWRGVT